MAKEIWIWQFFVAALSTIVLSAAASISSQQLNKRTIKCKPLVIAHRGASGYVPEHTLGAYALAITMGADYVEPDLVMSQDGHLIARHDNELGLTTDVAQRPEFANRSKTQTVDGKILNGWFTEDFTLAELKTLRVVERIPETRPGNARMDGFFQIPTFQEIIDLVKSLQISQKRPIGIYPEIKHSTYFQRLNLSMENLVVETFHENGYDSASSPVYIQSFEVNNLKYLKTITNLRLLQLYESDTSDQPFDQKVAGTGLTYADMATPAGLKEVATYASAVGPDKSYIIPRNADNTLGVPTNFVHDAHAVGLEVHPYTFRAENIFLPAEFRSEDSSQTAIGDLHGEIRAFIAAGIDGLFADQPDKAVATKDCL
ncbi:uncharacterized protein [Battus philenor]|uniref:uncharacterized protein n=1 Tax=Battus philenor TaxID=42288 RepID=UPI0035CECB03